MLIFKIYLNWASVFLCKFYQNEAPTSQTCSHFIVNFRMSFSLYGLFFGNIMLYSSEIYFSYTGNKNFHNHEKSRGRRILIDFRVTVGKKFFLTKLKHILLLSKNVNAKTYCFSNQWIVLFLFLQNMVSFSLQMGRKVRQTEWTRNIVNDKNRRCCIVAMTVGNFILSKTLMVHLRVLWHAFWETLL